MSATIRRRVNNPSAPPPKLSKNETKAEERTINISWELIKIVLLDFTAIPILGGVQHLSKQVDTYTLPIIGAAVLATVVYLAKSLLTPSKDPWYYFFVVCSFTCVIDLLLAFETIGLTDGVFDLWLNLAEEYLDTTWGAAINLVDATLHYSLYLYMIKKQLKKEKYDLAGMFWCGSILNSMAVLLGSAFWGAQQGIHPVKAGIILNIPYAIIPFVFFIQQFITTPSVPDGTSSDALKARLKFFVVIFVTAGFSVLSIPLISQRYECHNIFSTTQYFTSIGFTILIANVQGAAGFRTKLICFILGQSTHAAISHFLHCAVL